MAQQGPRERLRASHSAVDLTGAASLAEVIKRQSKPPVDLFCFYVWLQREGAEARPIDDREADRAQDALDFWLDVQQHENLCRAYFKDIAKQGRKVSEDWPQYYDLARRRGSIFNRLNGITQGEEEKAMPRDSESEKAAQALSMSMGPSRSQDEPDPRELQRTPSPTFEPTPRTHLSPTLKQLYPERPVSPTESHGGRRSFSRQRREPVQPVIHRDSAITKTDLIASAEVIFAKYLMQGAEKEIYMPSPLRIHDFPLHADILPSVQSPEYDLESEAMARIPDLFHAQKAYVFRQLEQDAFPRFLRAKAFGNISPTTALIHLIVGLFALWAGLATAFAMIFLDQPRGKRLWIILPLMIALFGIMSHSYELNPILVFAGFSEMTPFRTIRIREPYVHKLLVGRAIWVSFVAVAITAVLSLIFVLVPGHRL